MAVRMAFVVLAVFCCLFPQGSLGEDCYEVGKETEYHGHTSVTKSGRTCQKWSAHHRHWGNSAAEFSDGSASYNSNYCRETLPEAGSTEAAEAPWCWYGSRSGANGNWEMCDVPVCGSGSGSNPATSAPATSAPATDVKGNIEMKIRRDGHHHRTLPHVRQTTPTPGGSSGGSTGSKYDAAAAKAIVDSHNKYRSAEKATGMIKLQWDNDLAASAQKAADLCIFDHTAAGGGYTWPTVLTSKFGKHIGENIYVSSHSAATLAADRGVDSWASEKADYDFSNTKCASGEHCGHYTQVTWDSTTHVGCGITDCDNITGWHKGTIMFCQYGPAGNFNGRAPFTKGTTCSSCPSGSSCVDSLCESAGNVVVG